MIMSIDRGDKITVLKRLEQCNKEIKLPCGILGENFEHKFRSIYSCAKVITYTSNADKACGFV